MARAFAVAFYTELASGAPLRAAYELARGRVLAAQDDVPEAYYGHRDLGDPASESASPDPTDDHGFPWEFRAGTELVERWSLPDAAGNPEFGLPRLCRARPAREPVPAPGWFTAEHAEVFFGRGYQVRELYEQVTDPTGPPILLLYGASGVGKSSLLDAGLVPRLEAGGNAVRYCRRDQQKGLSGSLRDALQLSAEQTDRLNEAWRAEEARLGKPLVIFLDQVEEVFTRPDPAQPRELDEFVAVLEAALGNRDARPRGKLVLGFRKEWLAELDRRLAEAKLPRTPGVPQAARPPRNHRGDPRPGAAGPAPTAVSAGDRGRLARGHRRQPAGRRRVGPGPHAPGPPDQDVGASQAGQPRPAPIRPRSLRVTEGGRLPAERRARRGPEGDRPLEPRRRGIWPGPGRARFTTRPTSAPPPSTPAPNSTRRYAHQADCSIGLLGQCKEHYLLIEAEPQLGLPDRLDPTCPRPARAAGPATVPALGRPRPARPASAGEPRTGVA